MQVPVLCINTQEKNRRGWQPWLIDIWQPWSQLPPFSIPSQYDEIGLLIKCIHDLYYLVVHTFHYQQKRTLLHVCLSYKTAWPALNWDISKKKDAEHEKLCATCDYCFVIPDHLWLKPWLSWLLCWRWMCSILVCVCEQNDHTAGMSTLLSGISIHLPLEKKTIYY